MRILLAVSLIAVSLLSFAACGASRKQDSANADGQTIGGKVVDAAQACLEQTAKLKACDQLGMIAKALCRRAADKGACLNL